MSPRLTLTTDKENTMADTKAPEHHHLTLIVDSGELHRGLTCTAPPDADCHRRPAHYADDGTEGGHPCWAVEWVDAVGIEDAVHVTTDGVLASAPVTIAYNEGVYATPVSAGVESRHLDAATLRHVAQTMAATADDLPASPQQAGALTVTSSWAAHWTGEADKIDGGPRDDRP